MDRIARATEMLYHDVSPSHLLVIHHNVFGVVVLLFIFLLLILSALFDTDVPSLFLFQNPLLLEESQHIGHGLFLSG